MPICLCAEHGQETGYGGLDLERCCELNVDSFIVQLRALKQGAQHGRLIDDFLQQHGPYGRLHRPQGGTDCAKRCPSNGAVKSLVQRLNSNEHPML